MKERIIQLVNQIVNEMGYECVDVELLFSKKNKKLKVVIYRKGRDISMKDCADVNNVLRRKLDLEFDFSRNYDLIVESPGVNRKLRNLRDLEIFKDREIEFLIKSNEKGGNKKVVGRVEEIKDEEIRIITVDGEVFPIRWADVSTARLFFDIKKYL